MLVKDINLDTLANTLKTVFSNQIVRQYSGWLHWCDPRDLYDGSDIEENFCKTFGDSVIQNSFGKIEVDNIGDEKYIRLNSLERDEFDNTPNNIVIYSDMEIFLNEQNKQLGFIRKNDPVGKNVFKNGNIGSFVVFNFDNNNLLKNLKAVIRNAIS